MKVFKAYCQIACKNSLVIGIYVAVFSAVFIAINMNTTSSASSSFETTQIRTAIINQDEESALITGFTEFIDEYATLVTVEDDREAKQEAIFAQHAEYIITIPKGFSAAITKGEHMALDVVSIENSQSIFQMDILLDRYFNLITLFLKAEPDISSQRLNEKVRGAMSEGAEIILNSETVGKNRNYMYYFNFLPYILLSTTMLGITTVMHAFNRKVIYRRNIISPIKLNSMNGQIIIGNLTIGLLIWGILVVLGIAINHESITADAQLFTVILNSFILLIVSISLGSLIGFISKTSESRTAIINVVTLGSCFLGGVFISQKLMGDAVNEVARFIPTHWYMIINDLVLFEGASLGGVKSDEIAMAMGIQLLFAVTIIIVTVGYNKAKQSGAEQ